MKGKILFLAGIATGIALGSKAAREAYERLSAKAQEAWGDPNVRRVVSQAEQVAKEAASVAQTKAQQVWSDPSVRRVVSQAEQVAKDAASAAQATVSGLIDQATTAAGREQKHAAGTDAPAGPSEGAASADPAGAQGGEPNRG